MIELVGKAFRQNSESPSFDLNAKPLDSFIVDERPPSIFGIGICSTSWYIVSYIFMDNSIEFTPIYVMKLHAISEELNKIFVANLKWQHQWTIDFFFKSI